MTQKDYELIARVLSTTKELGYEQPTIYRIAFDLADALALTNARFDRVKFLKACGVWA